MPRTDLKKIGPCIKLIGRLGLFMHSMSDRNSELVATSRNFGDNVDLNELHESRSLCFGVM